MNGSERSVGLRFNKGALRMDLSLSSNLVQDDIPVEVVQGIFIGSKHAAFNQQALDEARITHILNLANIPATYPENYCYLTISIRDKDHSNLLSCIPVSNQFIQLALSCSGNCLVHCSYGASRSPALIVAFLVSCRGMSLVDALALVKSKRNMCNINQGFLEQLRALEQTGCNIHDARELVHRQHLERFTDALASNRSPRDHVLRKATSDISGIRSEQERYASQGGQCSALLGAVRPPPVMRLHDPHSGSHQALPTMASMDLQVVCKSCTSVLFYAHNTLKPMRARQTGRRRVSSPHSPRRWPMDTVCESKTSAGSGNGQSPRERSVEAKLPDSGCRLRTYSSESAANTRESKVGAEDSTFYSKEEIASGEAARKWGEHTAKWSSAEESKTSEARQQLQSVVEDINTACQVLSNDVFLVEPLAWMTDSIGHSKDKEPLRCYHCSHKLGGICWSGMEAPWGEFIVPAIFVNSSCVGIRDMCESEPKEPPRRSRKKN